MLKSTLLEKYLFVFWVLNTKKVKITVYIASFNQESCKLLHKQSLEINKRTFCFPKKQKYNYLHIYTFQNLVNILVYLRKIGYTCMCMYVRIPNFRWRYREHGSTDYYDSKYILFLLIGRHADYFLE